MSRPADIDDVVRALTRMAELLRAQRADGFRVQAYERAAESVAERGEHVRTLWQQGGPAALEGLPHLGPSLASAVDELLRTGSLRRLERLEGEVSPEQLFASIPGIGQTLAAEIHDSLHVDTLAQLELAAHDGRLAGLPGFGERRVHMVRDVLQTMLGHSARAHTRTRVDHDLHAPHVATLLALDRYYRSRARAGTLPRIAPSRFNPDREAWLPVLHVDHDGYHVTAMFSNTARAHRLGRTHDWVILFFDRHGHEGQCTVVTEHEGALVGKRVVRGRETECAEFYATHPEAEEGHANDEPPPLDALLALAERAARRAHIEE